MGYVDWRIHIERENKLFDAHLLEERENLTRLAN
jgi:hypothetical protein